MKPEEARKVMCGCIIRQTHWVSGSSLIRIQPVRSVDCVCVCVFD